DGSAALAEPEATPSSPATAQAAPAQPASAATPPSAPDLSPRAIALAALPSSAAQPFPVDRAALRSAQLSAELNAAANARPFPRRTPPQLKRDPDGTCHYEGEVIAATILPDGGVQFEDKPTEVALASVEPLAPGQLMPRGGVAEPPARPVTPEELVPEQRVEIRLKSSPHGSQAERAWFLRETAALRGELADATHARELALAARELRKRLERIWCDGSQRAEQRRRALFELWNETSDDEIGSAGRDAIVEYIRLNLPPSSPDAYPTQQLTALNADRAQRSAFDPYASP
ncbi:MAG TPA: hypothetical protein VK509_09995, partial [Polyangiales bacterium]|nr:hypothetical protein [Polyangiales bacterium]